MHIKKIHCFTPVLLSVIHILLIVLVNTLITVLCVVIDSLGGGLLIAL